MNDYQDICQNRYPLFRLRALGGALCRNLTVLVDLRKSNVFQKFRMFTVIFLQLGQSRSLVPWGCLPSRSSAITQEMHAWDLLLKFYDMKVRAYLYIYY